MQRSLAALLLVAPALLLAAQHAAEGRVRGLVMSGAVPVAGATVVLHRTTSEVETTTDSAGRFMLFALSEGTWQLDVRRIGYAPFTDSVIVGNGETQVVIPMHRAVVALDTLRVLANSSTTSRVGRLDAFRAHSARARIFGGSVFDRDQLASSDVNRLMDFLGRIPGASVTFNNPMERQVSFKRCEGRGLQPGARDTSRVFIDGNRVNGDAMAALANLTVADIEALEVYQGISQLPPEVTDGCSAIFVWTRAGARGHEP